jgi:hypothetical protein
MIMEQKDKELLLKYLCMALPYKVVIEYNNDGCSSTRELGLGSLHDFMCDNAECKPYLRPMSSMTEEEKHEFDSLGWRVDELDNNTPWNHNSYNVSDGVDWLNAHHLDFRGLIPMGIALEAKEGMYKF